MRSLVAIALSLAALPLFAVVVDPVAPTSATPVTIIVHELASCPPPEATRAGNTFTLLLKTGACLSPPANVTVELGKLPAGDYEVVVAVPALRGNVRIDYGAFFVRDADASIVVMSPQTFGPTTGGTEVILLPAVVGCFSADLVQCPMPSVSFNGVPATVVRDKFVTGTLAVIAPPGQKGIADVVMTGQYGTRSGRVFRYYDPNEAPLPTMFERVLVPVWFSGPGAFGSNWMTEVTLLNSNLFDFEPYRRSPHVVPHGQAATVLNFGAPRPGGLLFFPLRDLPAAPRFGSLVRDTSRQADDWGTEVRVVRESDFRAGDLSLLNIPVDAHFRQSVRIYGADSVETYVLVSVFAIDGTFIGGRSVQLRSAHPCNRYEPCGSDDPAFAMFDLVSLVPDVAGRGRVRVSISSIPSDRLWALATITNNATQHVTVITPQ